MRLFSYRGDIVLDPFNGAGTTTLVAAREGRRFIGIDLSLRYCQTALDRVSSLGIYPGTWEEGSGPKPALVRWGEDGPFRT